jgi:hypothetical protein
MMFQNRRPRENEPEGRSFEERPSGDPASLNVGEFNLFSKPLDSRWSLPSSALIGGGNDDKKYAANF